MDTQFLSNNYSKFCDFLRVLAGFVLLLPVDLEQLLNGNFATNWPIGFQLIISLSKLTIG